MAFRGIWCPENKVNLGGLSNPAREARREKFVVFGAQKAWKPWGNEAIRRAKRAGKFLGYSVPRKRETIGSEATRRAKRAGNFFGYK